MGEVSYEPLIKDMTWSYSRIKAFNDCPYRWYLKYIRYPRNKGKDLFFSNYGIFMHELLEAYNKGEKTAAQIKTEYLRDFRTRVNVRAPSEAIFKNYFMDGLQYLSNISPSGNKILSIENKAEFEICSMPFVAYIDLLEEEESGRILLIDNKSRVLKPRSTRKKPTRMDEELDTYLMQLYLYSHYVFIRYGKYPDRLCFNCFRKSLFIEEPFKQEAYDNAISWFLGKIKEITVETEFAPDVEYFRCRFLCEMQDYCDYYRLSKGWYNKGQ
jgi:RecB family exonuclease